jgi:putative glycosyltransferase (TIGR04372 family)
MDIFLTATCRFFFGVASGMAQVPLAFGVPTLFTNWISNALPPNSRRDLFIPKRVRSERLGRALSFDEWLAPSHRAHYVIATEMHRSGLREVDNTPEELCEAVVEMMDQLDGQATDDPADVRRREAFEAIARRQGLVGFARISRAFLRRHEQLLERQ